MASYGKGAQLEGTALEWLEDVRTLEDRGIRRTGAILAVSANEMLGRLEGSYKRLIDSRGADYRYTTQQQAARVNAIADKAGDFINPATRRQIIDLQKQDLVRAQQMGNRAGLDLEAIINDRSKTLEQNAKPNMRAIDAAGKRLGDFWSRENTAFRDRVRALTQVGAAQGLSYRKLANQVRELLLLERAQGTESDRSKAVNKKLGIQNRAELIARTEIQTAYVQGQIDQARRNEFAWGRWSAGGERTCGFCISRHGMIYELDDIEGQIPAHPRCRCTVIPVEAPDGWKKGDKVDPKTTELDDEFWTGARERQIKEWKRDQNTNRRGERKPPELLKSSSELDDALRRYLNTPTNTQQYLMPGSDAPAPLWKPSGNTIPDPAAAAANAAAAAEAQAQAQAAADLAEAQAQVKERPDEGETFRQHSNADGAEPDQNTIWTAERAKLHDDILNHFLKDGVKSKNPTFTMSGGGPASGKGFMLKKTGLDQPGKVVLDADEIKKLIPEYAKAQKEGGAAQQKAASRVHEESSYLAKKLMAAAAERGFDVVLDGTGDNGYKSLKKKVDKMRAAGYRVEAKYVSADTDLAAQRNWDRFLKTGRLPPEHMLRNVHRDVSRTLPEAMDKDLFDAVELYDTNKSGELRLVVSKTQGQKAKIKDQQLWDDFLRKGEAETWTAEQGEKAIAQRKLQEDPKATDTAQRHSNARGQGAEPTPDTVWTAERAKLHDEIVAHFLKNGKVSDNPTFTMSGGGPASGKGFMLKKTGLDQPGKVVIDADEIKKLIPEYGEMQKAGGKQALKAASYVHEESSYLAKRIMGEAADAGFDVVLDGTGDNGVKSLKKKVDKMREKGYRVEAKYVSADTEVAVQRNWDRFLKTGRLPPEHMLRNVHRDVSRTLPDAMDQGLFDKVELYDTNKSGELRLVASQDGPDRKPKIHDQKLWEDFKRKGDADVVTEADVKKLQEARQLKEDPAQPDTASRYSNARGQGAEPNPDSVWTADRKKLHDDIVEQFLKDGVVSKNPTFTMSGGGPASGKGFMLAKTGLDQPGKVVVDSDEIKKLLPEYRDMQKAGGDQAKKAAGYVHEESSYLAKRIMDAAADRGFDVILDGTGDNGLKSLAKKVDKMRAKGYKVEAKYVSADTEVAAQRNWERFLKTGRLPPESMLRNVHRDVSRTLPDALDADLFDKVDLYDTNKSGELRPVISKVQGKPAQVHDQQLWDRFLRKADAKTYTAADDAKLMAAQEKRQPTLDAPAKPKAEPKPKKAIEERIEAKFVEPKSAKIKAKDFVDGLKAYKAQGGDVGANIDRLMRFQERYNISTITGTGNEKPDYFLFSKQLQSSLAAAQARKTATDKFGYGNDKAFAEALREMTGSTLAVNMPTAKLNLKVSKTPGVGGSTADGMGAVKIKVSKHHQKLTPERLAELQKAVEQSVIDSKAGKPHIVTSERTYNTEIKGSKSAIDWFTNYIHEMGHQIHYAMGQPMPTSVAAMNWKPSKYGTTNKQEWFAETFTQYVLAPEALRQASPQSYKFVDDMVKRAMVGKPGEVGRAESLGIEAPQRTITEDLVSIKGKTVKQLQAEAKAAGLKGYSKLKKAELEDLLAGALSKTRSAPTPTPTKTTSSPTPTPTQPKVAKPKAKTLVQLKAEAKALGLKGYSKLKKAELEQLLASSTPAPVASAPVAKTTPKVATPLPKLPADGFKADGTLTLKGETFTPGKTLSGSTKPQLFNAANGDAVVVKGGGAAGQNAAEFAAQRVYGRIDPTNGLNSRLIDGKLVNDFLQDAKLAGQLSAAELKKHRVAKHLRTQTAADALLANWDVKGLSNDNVMVASDGRIVKIDAGGTFDYRAQGKKKKYGSVPDELFTLRDGQGQLSKDWANAVDADYRRLYLYGVDDIAQKAAALRKDVAGLPKDVQQAFSDRLDVYTAVSEFATGQRKLSNGKTVQEAVDAGELDWQTFDFKVKQAFDAMNANAIKSVNMLDKAKLALEMALDMGPPPAAAKPKTPAKQKSGTGDNSPDMFTQMFGNDIPWADYVQPKTMQEFLDWKVTDFNYMNKQQLMDWNTAAQKVIKLKSTGVYEANQIYDKGLAAIDQIKHLENGGAQKPAPVLSPPELSAAEKAHKLVQKYVNPKMTLDEWNAKPPHAQKMALKMAKSKQAKARANTDEDWSGYKKPKDAIEFIAIPDISLEKMSTKQLNELGKLGNQFVFEKNTNQVLQAIANKTVQIQNQYYAKQSKLQAKSGVAINPPAKTAQQLVGTTILGAKASLQQEFMNDWGNANQIKQFPNIPVGSAVHKNVLTLAAKNEKAYYQGESIIKSHIDILSAAERRTMAKKIGLQFGPKTTDAEIKKMLFIAEGSAKDFNTYKDVTKPSDYINKLAPGTVNTSVANQPTINTAPAADINAKTFDPSGLPGTGGATPQGYLEPKAGKFNPLKDSIAKQEAIRGTSTHQTPLWDTYIGSYTKNQGNQDVLDAVGEALQKAGHPGDYTTVAATLRALQNYTGGAYRGQKAVLMEKYRPDLYDMLPSEHKNDGKRDKRQREAPLVEALIESLPLWRAGRVTRGMTLGSGRARANFLQAYANGDQIGSMDSYSSAMHTAEGFDGGSHGIMMHVERPQRAVSVKGMSQIAGENEVLFTRHTRFKIVKMAWDEDGLSPAKPEDAGKEGGRYRQLHVWLEEIV